MNQQTKRKRQKFYNLLLYLPGPLQYDFYLKSLQNSAN